MSWREIIIGDAIHVKHGFAFKSQHFSDNGEYIVLTPGNFNEEGGFRLRPGKDRFYVGDIPEEYILSKDDLIIAMTEQGSGLLGSSALIPDGDKFLHNQRLGLIQDLDETVLDKKFLYYLFNTRSVRGQISGSATGTKVKHTAPERIYRVKATVPSKVRDQKKIAFILSAYDDLIENNRRRIQLLEESARLLYREWFVRLRFPGHQHVKSIDGVPEGWEKTTVGSVSSFISRGITPKYDEKAPGIVLNQKCIRNQRVNMGLARRQSKEVPPNKLVRHGDVLINSTGQGTLGRVAQFIDSIENCTVDSHVTIARPSEDLPVQLYGHNIASMEDFLATMGRGATNQTELSKDTVAELSFLCPPHLLTEQFEVFAKATAIQVQNMMQQNTMLVKARNLLLPRLMNGEIEV